MTIKNVPALKLRFLSNRKLQTWINHVSLNIEKLSTNTNKYLNVQCACNEDSSFPCLCLSRSSFPSPWQQDYGEGNARGILDLLLPICTFVFLVAEVWIISFVFPHVHVNNSPQRHKAIHTEINIIHRADHRGMRSLTWEWTDLQKIWTVRCSTPKLWNSASRWIFKQSSQIGTKKSNFREQIFLPYCPKFQGNPVENIFKKKFQGSWCN